MRRTGSRRGNTAVEFALIGIPLLFVVIGIVEISRGMWIYDTLVHATQTTARIMVVRGTTCATYVTGCGFTVGNYATNLSNSANGLDPSKLSATFTSQSSSVTCNPLNTCFASNTAWPPSADNRRGFHVWVFAKFPFNSALAMFWPGSHTVSFGNVNLSANTRQQIQF